MSFRLRHREVRTKSYWRSCWNVNPIDLEAEMKASDIMRTFDTYDAEAGDSPPFL